MEHYPLAEVGRIGYCLIDGDLWSDLQSLRSDTEVYEAVSSADVDFSNSIFRKRKLCRYGTAPGEWWGDYTAALDPIRKQMASVGNAVELVSGDVRAYREGDAGWVADQPTLKLGSVAALCRHTSVFVLEAGEWRIVQHHFSIGVSNEEVFGSEGGKLG